MDLGETPSLTMWGNEYGFMSFSLNQDKLFVNFKSMTENFNVEEVLVYEWDQRDRESYDDYKREYTYQIGYCKKGIELTDGNRNINIAMKNDYHF